MRPKGRQALDTIEGTVESVRYRSSDTGFTVLVASVDGTTETLVGDLAGAVEKGAKFVAHGNWTIDQKFGRQFRFEALETRAPTTEDQIIARLKTYPGIGQATAERIVEQLGEKTWEMIDRDPGILIHIPGIGAKAVAKIRAHHKQQHGPIARLRMRLVEVGAPPSLAKSIHETYGDLAKGMLDNHPYQVATKVARFGFHTAERFARSTGLDPETGERVEAGVVHALRELRTDGHCCSPAEDLTRSAMGILGVREQAVDEAVERLLERGVLRYRFDRVFMTGTDAVEARVARLLTAITRPVRMVWGSADVPEHFSPGQRKAVEAVARSGVTIVSGGPGTGKSTVVGAVVEMAERAGQAVHLCAPTGRAARRLAEATGRPASTIHRLLRPIVGSADFHHDAANPLPPGMVVVDEVSMVDLELADALFGALTEAHRVLLVGDADQLPSVGPGNVLADLIEAAEGGCNIALVRLEQVFRQAEGSSIVVNAHRLLSGKVPVSDDPKLGNAGQFYFIPAETPEKAQEKIVTMASVRIPAAYEFEPVTDVQVLSPVHRGPAGTDAFNAVLQQRYGRYPPREYFWGAKGRRFGVGDRVMQTRNDYERGVFNGDLGLVTEFDETFLTVDFDGAVKRYKRFDLATLQLAYGMTIHKSQGGEFPAVLVPVLRGTRMLNRNLLYTAVTRAKSLCVLVGHWDAIERAVQTSANARWTCLGRRLLAG